MKNKLCLTLLLWGIIYTQTVLAGKVLPGAVSVTQADKSTLSVVAYGDEHLAWYTTTDGVLLYRDGYNYYVAKVDTGGNLTSSGQLAHEASLRTPTEVALAKAQNRNAFYDYVKRFSQAEATRAQNIGTSNPSYFPHMGSPKAVVLLVEFQDTVFKSKDPKATFNHYLNANANDPIPANNDIYQSMNFGSVKQYFSYASQGKFTPQFDLYGPYKLTKSSAYYGEGRQDMSSRIQEMIKEACSAADKDVDFSQYDADRDGNVDLVYIIYAGYSESDSRNSTNDIWPKSGVNVFGNYDGKNVLRYGINNELNFYPTFSSGGKRIVAITGIGLFCHEFSHTMGLPDLYPTTDAAKINNQTMEDWDLMDGGEYVNNGYTPTQYTPWELETMGWLTAEELSTEQQITLQPFVNEKKVLKITSDDGQYLLLQNIQSNGNDWYKGLVNRGSGLLVYRIDYRKDNVNIFDYPNNTAGSPGVTIVPADNLLITSYKVSGASTPPTGYYSATQYIESYKGDPYPGSQQVNQIEQVTLNRDVVLKKPIYNIKEENKVITFDFLKDFTASAVDVLWQNRTDDQAPVYNLQGVKVGNSLNNLPPGIYIRNGKKFVVK